MSTNVVRSLSRLDLFDQLSDQEQDLVAKRLRTYLESHPDVVARLRAVLELRLDEWSMPTAQEVPR